MKLTEEDKSYLLKLGHRKEDLKQIERAIYKTDYTFTDRETGKKKEISSDEAYELLGKETYLSGLSRSAFHWSALRDIPNTNNYIYFDTSRLFK